MGVISLAATLLGAASLVNAAANPIQVSSAVILGNQTSTNDPGTYRDGGWESQIGNNYFQFYADTLNCDKNNPASNCQSFRANTLAQATSNPQQVKDFGSPVAQQLCSDNANGYRLHLTNVISLSSTTGVAWYTNITQPNSNSIDGDGIGSGVAIITYDGTHNPTCQVIQQFWGPDEPNWGDHGAIGHNLDGYIYMLGALGGQAPGNNYSDVWAARVAPGSVQNVNAYQYWNGSAYTSTRLIYPNFNGYAPASVLQGTAQGSIFYNNYYNTYIYLSPVPGLSASIQAQTAQVPSGPWSSPVTIFKGNNLYYAPVAQPHFDTSGKTLIFDMSIFSPIYLQTVKVTFK